MLLRQFPDERQYKLYVIQLERPLGRFFDGREDRQVLPLFNIFQKHFYFNVNCYVLTQDKRVCCIVVLKKTMIRDGQAIKSNSYR